MLQLRGRIYRAELVPYREGLSKVSFESTDFKCATDGCTDVVRQILIVPGEQIGHAERVFRVLRCLSCRFDDPCYTHYGSSDEPVKVETKFGETGHSFSNDLDQLPVGLMWNEQNIDPDLHGWQTFAGHEPLWLQIDDNQRCPGCGNEMEFIFQVASTTLSGRSNERGEPWREPVDPEFDMEIEYNATLYFFDCPKCRIWASVTQCT